MPAQDDCVPAWVDQELAGCAFRDVRLGTRFRMLLARLGSSIGESIPLVCQDWANTKAAYRFFSNERVSEEDILAGHFQSTRSRFEATDGTVLVLHDTTEFSYQRERIDLVGMTTNLNCGRDTWGQSRMRRICGILMHSSLAVTMDGLPLGLASVKFWTRKTFKGANALKRKINPTRVPIEDKESIRWLENLRQSTTLLAEPARCVHIGDRESDIYELFCTAQHIGTHFLVRTCVDRLAGDGRHTIAREMAAAPVSGLHRIDVRNDKGEASEALLEIRYRRIRVLPPIGKKKQYPSLYLTVIHACERTTPKGRKKIIWKLITDLHVGSLADAVEKLDWYAMRWKIETFHKIMKSGCKAENSKLRTAQRLTNLLAVLCILSWRVFWMTMVNRSAPGAAPAMALTKMEVGLLDRLAPDRRESHPRQSLSGYIVKIARLGGYLARSGDPPPGNIVIWRGMSRLTDIALGFSIGAKLVGN